LIRPSTTVSPKKCSGQFLRLTLRIGQILKTVLDVVSPLIVGLTQLRDQARLVTREHLQSDEAVDDLIQHPLRHSFALLNGLMITRSQEALDFEAERKMILRDAKTTRKYASLTQDNTPIISDDVQSILSPHGPSTLSNTPKKRDFSSTSFEDRSAQSTPKKLVSPESNIQYLQDTLVRDVIDAVFCRPYVPVKWPRGRKNMRLVYEP